MILQKSTLNVDNINIAMQHLLKKINYYNSPFTPSQAWSPFEQVP